MELNKYIKHDFVENEFRRSCLIISDIDSAELLASSPSIDNYNIIFDTSYIKFSFLKRLKIYHPHVKIITCDASKKRLINELNNIDDELVVFDKINYCTDSGIFKDINNIKYRILIC